LKRKRTKFDKKKTNYKGWNWETISIKKRIITTKINNKKSEDHIWDKKKNQGIEFKDKLIQSRIQDQTHNN
jgi:hypothetical protein